MTLFKRKLPRRELLRLIGLGAGLSVACLLGTKNTAKTVSDDSEPFQVHMPLVDRDFQGPFQLKGLSYSPYRDDQNPDWGPYPNEEQIKADIDILDPIVGYIRTYGSDHNLENIPRFFKEKGSHVKINAGCWLGSDLEVNDRLIDSLITEANQSTNVISVTVGNETQQFGTVSEQALIGYINRVRSSIPRSITVTTADTWYQWQIHPNLVNAVDYVLAHFFPYWEPNAVPIDGAVAFVQEKYHHLQTLYPGKRIVIGETGWPSGGATRGGAVPSLENQRRYIDAFLAWADQEKIDFYLFEAFDEEWKMREGEVGGHWGIYFSNRTPKHPGLSLK